MQRVNAFGGDYPMDYNAQDGVDWNSSYVKPARKISVTSVANSVISK
jgi:2-(3-amino-3-carboxypropyl)histidine synthase